MAKTEEISIDPIVEWAVFCHLDQKTDLELILLKGHLLIEAILETVIKRNCKINLENHSFHRKLLILDKIEFPNTTKKGCIVSSLRTLNKLRNKIAHEFLFDISNGEFESWASNIFENFKGKKFSKYTFRTKIVHAFSVLAKNMLAMKN